MMRRLHIGAGILASLKIKYKLLLSYFLLIIIPLGILGFMAYNRSSSIIQNQIKTSAEQVLDQTHAFLSFKLNNVANVSNLIVTSAELRNILQKGPAEYTIHQQIDDANQLVLYLKNMEYNNGLLRIRLFIRDNLLYSNENVNIFNMNVIVNTDFYKDTNAANGRILWTGVYAHTYLGQDEKRILSASRIIKNTRNFKEIIGIVSIDILESELLDIINKANYTGKGLVYLINESGEIICLTETTSLDKRITDREKLKELAKSSFSWKKLDFNGMEIIAGSKTIDVTGWKLISIIPLKEMMAPNYKLSAQFVGIVLLIGGGAYSVAYYITYSNTKRLNRMVKTMRCVQKGDLSARVIVDSGDEIGEVQQNFNYMADKVNQLMKESYETGQAARNAELKALQAQINPHFLYNTLDMLYWMAKRNNPRDMCDAITSLARFYKLSLSKGREMIPIRDEIEHVSLYVAIQNLRFENRIKLGINVDDTIFENSILKLILQPLAENSILHGIMQKQSKSGYIKINSSLKGNIIEIRVEDDGIGMSDEKINLILSSSGSNGYGVRNINERIKIRYGSDFGLEYKSDIGRGTIVTVRIPTIKTID